MNVAATRVGPRPPTVELRTRDGRDLAPDSARWFAAPDADDLAAIDDLSGPVLDVGCGPGRIVAHLTAVGIPALGVDVSAAALDHARRLGAPVLHRSVFDPLPGTGRWGAALLLDGNVGIGGDPVALLGRLRELLRRGGAVVAEVGAPGTGTGPVEARFRVDGVDSDWFPWALLAAEDVGGVATAAGLRCSAVGWSGPRWFATLHRP